ncbi:MAG: helix-turn-helix domain-containing protein [Patescibacteria group bacterium]
MLIKELQKIGLSDKEAKVYLAVLGLGKASVQTIAAKAGVNRATTYSVLGTLKEKGLCSTFQKVKKTFYVVSSPEYLKEMFEIKKVEIEEKQKTLEVLLPELSAIYSNQKQDPVIRYFEGKQGMLNCVKELSNKTSDIEPLRMIYNRDLLNQTFTPEEREKYKKIRLGNRIQSKVLYNNQAGEISSSPDGQRIRIPAEKFPITCDIGIRGDKVRIASLGKRLSAVLITDKEIAGTLKALFDLAFEAAQARKDANKS